MNFGSSLVALQGVDLEEVQMVAVVAALVQVELGLDLILLYFVVEVIKTCLVMIVKFLQQS